MDQLPRRTLPQQHRRQTRRCNTSPDDQNPIREILFHYSASGNVNETGLGSGSYLTTFDAQEYQANPEAIRLRLNRMADINSWQYQYQYEVDVTGLKLTEPVPGRGYIEQQTLEFVDP